MILQYDYYDKHRPSMFKLPLIVTLILVLVVVVVVRLGNSFCKAFHVDCSCAFQATFQSMVEFSRAI